MIALFEKHSSLEIQRSGHSLYNPSICHTFGTFLTAPPLGLPLLLTQSPSSPPSLLVQCELGASGDLCAELGEGIIEHSSSGELQNIHLKKVVSMCQDSTGSDHIYF